MQSGIIRCATTAGKIAEDDGMQLDNNDFDNSIKTVASEDYKYLGVLKATNLLQNQVKGSNYIYTMLRTQKAISISCIC